MQGRVVVDVRGNREPRWQLLNVLEVLVIVDVRFNNVLLEHDVELADSESELRSNLLSQVADRLEAAQGNVVHGSVGWVHIVDDSELVGLDCDDV